jgi:glutathione synthase/RimK-type ligase-like ATP-grasp enzyme
MDERLDFLRGFMGERVYNSKRILRWNLKKTYLRELESLGVCIVPTVWMDEAPESEIFESFRSAFPGKKKVIKPILGAGSVDTFLIGESEAPPVSKFVNRPAMIQPYLSEIERDGERSMIYFSGNLSHSILKRPKAGDFRVQESFGGRFSEFSPSPEEKKFGDNVIRRIRTVFPEELAPLYSRIDYVLIEGVPHLMEAELLEPDLFFHHSEGSGARFVEAILRL